MFNVSETEPISLASQKRENTFTNRTTQIETKQINGFHDKNKATQWLQEDKTAQLLA